MTLLNWVAVIVVILTIAALIKRYETRLVLFTAGLILCCVSLQPMTAFNAFAKSMTNGGLIMAICASMGFAYVSSYTRCDQHLVHLLSKPIRGLGIFLVPICTFVTMVINIAIPSASGCAAAVGSTLIPVMLRAGIRPAMDDGNGRWCVLSGFCPQRLHCQDLQYGNHGLDRVTHPV